MRKRLSDFQKAARERWPESYKEHSIDGDGNFAIVCCSFFHPSARRMCYGEIYLFETEEQAEKAVTNVYCHASSKGLCKGKHRIERVLRPQ